jgi:hypothetical protein
VGFATIAAALTYIAPFIIPPDKTVTIHVYKGTFASAAAILVNHPNAQQITITGEPRVDKTITAINNLDATHKNVTVNNTTGLVVGQHVYIANTTGGWAGGCMITAIAGLVVTCTVEKADAQAAYTTSATFAGQRLSYYPTVLTTTGNTIFSCPFGIGSLTNLTMDGGDNVLHGISTINGVSVWNTGSGMNADTLTMLGENVFTKCTSFGIISSNLVKGFAQTYVNACAVGIACQSALIGSQGGGQDSTLLYLSHNGVALQVYGGAQFRGGSLHASSNNNVVLANLNSTALINPGGGYQSVLDNNGTALKAQGNSYIAYVSNGAASPSCDPPADTLGNQNSLIHIS